MTTNDFTPHGFMTLSNLGGIEIEISRSNDSARLRLYGKYVTKWKEILYNINGEAYVKFRNVRYKLNEFMKVN